MPKTQKPDTDPAPKPSRATVILMLMTIGSTTWRIFLPALGGLGIGIWLDARYQSAPWFTVLGIFVGSWMSVWLVYRQLKTIRTKI